MVKVQSFVYYEHPNTDYVIEHKHDSFECIFFLEGKATISMNNVVYSITSPSIAIVPPNEVHDEKEVTNTKMFIVLFTQDDDSLKNVDIQFLNDEQHTKILHIFNEIYNIEKENDNSKANQQKKSSLFSLVISLLKAFRFMEEDDEEQIKLTQFAKSHIERNYSLNIDYKSLAKSYGYSYSRFRHIFKERVGVAPHQYCLSLRLNNAKKLLKETNFPINKVAKNCGFESESSFDVFFTNEMSITPSEFRRIVKVREDGDVIQIGERKL